MKTHFTRRNFLRLAALSGSATLLPNVPVLSANNKLSTRRGERKKVLIIGAGMAGMSAGIELIGQGHDVTILEGRMRAGGRVQTLRSPLAPGLYADLGAARIPENHDWTMKYINKYGLQTVPFNPTEGTFIQYMKGKRMKHTATTPVPLEDYPLKLKGKEYKLGWQNIVAQPFEPIMRQLGDPTKLDWPSDAIKSFDNFSFKGYLRDQGYSSQIADILFIGWEKEGAEMNMSVLESMREFSLSFGAPRVKVVGGNDLIPTNMAQEISDYILYGQKVLDIQQTNEKVFVTVEQTRENITYSADYLICTLPLTVLRNMDVVETFSQEKQNAVNNYGYWDLSRSILQVSDRYWKEEGFNGFAATDQPTEIWDPMYEVDGKRGMIANYIKHNDSRKKLAELTDEERLEFSMNHIDEVFPGIRRVYEGGYTKCWGEDPWSLGAHSIGEVGQMTNMLQTLFKPEGRIYIAGEHASAYHGWMQGALESGARCAKEINDL